MYAIAPALRYCLGREHILKNGSRSISFLAYAGYPERDVNRLLLPQPSLTHLLQALLAFLH
jgi:hypothetical protein